MQITREVFEQRRRPRFGTSNPERMRIEFWEWMIRGEDGPPPDEGAIHNQLGLVIRRDILKSAYGPYRARDLFQVPLNRDDGPIWTFDRMGATRTELPDGRMICVGGEHEDSYDPDFCIYNDVVVIGRGDDIEIYGYPKKVFPPTDFHTATLVGNQILIIGSVGYPEDRCPGKTPVFSLDLSNYRMSKVPTTGEAPGWVAHHEAVGGTDGVITIRGGKTCESQNGNQRFWRNVEEFALDTRTGLWHRLTRRNWRQFAIRQKDHGWFSMEHCPAREALFPSSVKYTPEPGHEEVANTFVIGGVRMSLTDGVRFTVRDVPVSVTVDVSAVEIVVEGDLPVDIADRMAEEVCANVERDIQRPCVLERM